MDREAARKGDASALWSEWTMHRGTAARNNLLEHYRWFARAMARRALRERNNDPDLDRDELEQLGMIGLMESIESYSPRPGSDFVAYASKRVYGSIVDGISRSSDLRAQLSAAHHARNERIRSIGRESSKRDRLNRLVDIAIGLAIGIMLEDTAMFVDAGAEPDGPYVSHDLEILRGQFTRIVDELPGKQGEVVRHHYYYDIPFAEIAELLGVSKPRVSQLHAAALRVIREQLRERGMVDHFY